MTIGTRSYSTICSSGITTTTVATVRDSTDNTRKLYILLDTGCSNSILSDNYLKNIKKILKNIKKSKSHSTAGAPLKTSRIDTLTFKLSEFSTSKNITWQVDMDSGKFEELCCDMFIGRTCYMSLWWSLA